MFREALKYMSERDINWRAWEREFKADRARPVFPSLRVCQRYGGVRIHGKDKEGAQVIYNFVGQRDCIGIMRCVSADEWTRVSCYCIMALHEYRTRSAPPGLLLVVLFCLFVFCLFVCLIVCLFVFVCLLFRFFLLSLTSLVLTDDCSCFCRSLGAVVLLFSR
jgi:hypothetical protein